MHDARKLIIVWAIEAFPTPQAHVSELKMASALRWHFPNSTIIPVYVLSDRTIAARGIGRFLRHAIKPAAFKALRRFFAETSSVHNLYVTRPRILREKSSSQDECAHKLVRFAEKVHADFIALGSRGIPLFARLMGFSFSEAVLRFSRIPLFFVGPNSGTCTGPPSSVIFAGDLTSTPPSSMGEILKFVADFGAELHLFHKKESNGFNPFKDIGISLFTEALWTAHHSFHSEQTFELNILKCLRQWVDLANSKGIKTRLANENFRESNTKAIVQYLRQLGDTSALVAMTARTKRGPLLGDVARDVIRMSPFPVFISPDLDQV